MKKKIIILVFILIHNYNFATNYYISGSGNDNNNGLTTTTAYRNIQKAADIVNPGDTVFVMNGLYNTQNNNGDIVTINRSGTSSQWIVFKNYQTDKPKIEFNGWSAFSIQPGAAYIEINGFEIQGNNKNVTLADALNQFHSCNNPGTDADPYQPEFNGSGIAADGRFSSLGFNKPHHINVLNNIIYDCGGGGISMIQSDYLTIKSNLVYDNSWYTIFGASGISIYQSWNSDSNTTDFKMIVEGNICHNNRLFVPWYFVCAFTDGNGIIIDDCNNTQNGSTLGEYTGKTLIQNNILYNNGGSGAHVYESKHVTIRNNTAYKNSQTPEINDGQIFANASDDCKIINNILFANDDNVTNSNYNNTNLTYENNLHYNGTTIALSSPSCVVGNPNFVDEANFDFHLKSDSPAINVGNTTNFSATDFDGNVRSNGSNPDIGAFEFGQLNNPDFGTIDNIKVFPNPTSGILNFESSKNVDKVDCVNMLGQKINLNLKNKTVDMKQLSNGIYRLFFYLDNQLLKSVSIIKK